ncbi:MAG: hypothetical protein P4L27_14975 [Ignavibacteriaceae bacterium]|nr:hypothetical protein [Ignavibacteriaceae bacterium]
MALAHGLMQEMSGVLGDVVIVHRGKKTFIKKRPEKSKNPLTELAMEKREKFALGGKIAGAISSIIEVKKLWAPNPEENQTSYNRMFIANHGQFNIEDLTGKIVVSDVAGLEILNPTIELGNSGVEISCDWYESKDINKREAATIIMAAGIIALINPAEEDKQNPYQFMTFKTEMFPIDENGKFSAKVEYPGGDLMKFQAYQSKKAFGVFVTLDEGSNPIDISETFESGL